MEIEETPQEQRMKSYLAERVLAGVEVLDDCNPGWWKRIDLPQLDMRSCERCVLGQLYRNYADGLDELSSTLNVYPFEGQDFGFDLPEDSEEYERFADGLATEEDNPAAWVWDEMAALWWGIVEQRRADSNG